MKNFKFKWLLLSIVLSIASINTMWATLSFNGDNNGVKFSKSSNNGTNYYDHEIKHGTTNSTQDVGIVTNLYLKEYFVQLYQDEDNYTGTTHVFYWFYQTSSGRPGGAATSYSGSWGDWGSWDGEGKRYPKFGNNNISDDGGTTNVNLLYGKGAGEYTFEYYFNAECKNGWAPVVCSNGGGNFKATFTVPGFNTASISKSFGTTIPVETESETTIGFNHYGTALTTSNCSITGTNASMFTVRSINESGVTVSFSPGSSTGYKSAKLTITDAHSKRCEITLSATVVAAGTKTRLYFNNFINKDGIKSNSNWTKDGALSRFTVQYTTGVYTHYPMTQCANSTYNYYADVEIKGSTVSVDRYNPSSPYNTWNTASISGINTTNRYAQLDNYDGNFYGFATNHPYNDVSGGNIYYDNSKSGLTNTIYLVVGHDYKMTDGGGDTEYSKAYALGNITNTKLYYGTFADTWHDADYYAFIGASSAPSAGEWGSNDLSSKASSSSYTGIFRDVMDLKSGSTYLGFAPSKTGGALSMTKSPTLNTTQTFNYALSTDGGSSYPALTSGVNTPGKLSMSSFEFTNAKCTTVTAKTAQELVANATTYTKAVSNVAYTGTTVLTESNTRDGYSFIGWYEGNTLLTASAGEKSYTYYPRGNKTYTARYKAHRYTIAFDNNDDQYSSAPAATGTMDPISNVVYDRNQTLTANAFIRNGYTFAGWSTTPSGSVDYSNSASVSNLTATDGETVTLYAQWTEDTHEVTLANDGHGHVEISGATVTEVSGIGITTASSSITAVPNDGYHFASWTGDINNGVTIASGSGTATITINATADSKTITANFAGNEYTVTFDQEGGEGGSANVTATYGSAMPAITLPHKIGYKFDGYWDGDDGTGNQYYNADGSSTRAWNKASTATLHAKWTADSNEFTNDKGDGNWNDPDNWSAGVVPTNSYAAVQLSGELNVSSYIHVGSMDLTASGAKLTIQAGGTLEVAGAITNTDPSKLVIQTGNEGQGALIYDITKTAPHATVNMTTRNAAGSHYQYIASPIGGVSVSDVFSGKGAYTYVWKEGIGWERRGYYDEIAAFEPIALKGKGSCSFVGQLYPGTTSLSLSYTGTPTSVDAQGVNMLANALTAPIKIAAMTISGSSDGSVHVWNNGTWDDYAVSTAGENVIPAMQVYAILASSSGSVSFDYTTAILGASNKNAALKAPKRITSDIPEHITISVRTNERDIDLQLYEDEMFTNEIDKGWEAIYMEGDGRFGELYALADEKMSILATPDLEGTILGFAPGETSNYTISFSGDGKGYYLNDMKEQKSTLIAEENTYMFSPDESTNATRFVISRTPIHKVPTGTENVSAGTNARKQMINGVLYIIREGRIYNAEGALVK